MTRSRVMIAALLAAAMLAVAAPAAHASVPAANSKFCKAVQKYTADLSSVGSSKDTARLKVVAKALKNAAKSAPPKVKAATIVVANYFVAVADQDADAIQNTVQKFSKAATTFSKYFATSCISAADSP